MSTTHHDGDDLARVKLSGAREPGDLRVTGLPESLSRVRMTLVGSWQPNAQGDAGELVDHVQHPNRSPIIGSTGHEVVGPDVVTTQRWQLPQGVLVITKCLLTCAFSAARGHLQAFLAPQSLDAFLVDLPALLDQECVDHPVAPLRVPARQLRHPGHHPGLEIGRDRGVAVGRSVLPDQSTRTPLTDAELLLQMSCRVASTGRA